MQRAFSSLARLLALSALGAYLLTIAMAFCPAMHHWLHDDSNEADHHCVVTALLDGQFDESGLHPVSTSPPVLHAESGSLLNSTTEHVALFFSVVQGRAPPVS